MMENHTNQKINYNQNSQTNKQSPQLSQLQKGDFQVKDFPNNQHNLQDGINEIPNLQQQEQDAEQKHFMDILHAFFNYRNDAIRDIVKQKYDFLSIGDDVKYLHFDFNERFMKLQESIDLNYEFLMIICLQYQDQVMQNLKIEQKINNQLPIPNLFIDPKNIGKMRSTLKQFVRDWSEEGKQERQDCYQPCIDEVVNYFPKNFNDLGERIKILMPGAGLGRLVYEFAKLGYGSQGNEFTYFMLIASDFILNQCDRANQFKIQPFIHTFLNNYSEKDAFQKISIPDEYPYDQLDPNNTDFSMVAGEFIEVYKGQIAEWDSVVTCFFIDTANNIIAYIKTIHNILKKGGLWVNFGPLLYHYTEMANEISIELSWEELQIIIQKMGFEIKKQEFRKCTYAQCRKSMMTVVYDCIFFTAVKTSDNIL